MVVHSGIWNQYTAKILVHFQYTFEGQKKKTPLEACLEGLSEVPSRIELLYLVLQTNAYPLGHSTIWDYKDSEYF